jgi:hypothetical protein
MLQETDPKIEIMKHNYGLLYDESNHNTKIVDKRTKDRYLTTGIIIQ